MCVAHKPDESVRVRMTIVFGESLVIIDMVKGGSLCGHGKTLSIDLETTKLLLKLFQSIYKSYKS